MKLSPTRRQRASSYPPLAPARVAVIAPANTKVAQCRAQTSNGKQCLRLVHHSGADTSSCINFCKAHIRKCVALFFEQLDALASVADDDDEDFAIKGLQVQVALGSDHRYRAVFDLLQEGGKDASWSLAMRMSRQPRAPALGLQLTHAEQVACLAALGVKRVGADVPASDAFSVSGLDSEGRVKALEHILVRFHSSLMTVQAIAEPSDRALLLVKALVADLL